MKLFFLFFILFFSSMQAIGETYQIEDEFVGCEYGKIYPLVGNGLLECHDYNYSFDFFPIVRTNGKEVITIGRYKISGIILDGSILKTKVRDTLEGCDYDKKIYLENNFIFVCKTYSYSYSYKPDVTIVMITGRSPIVYIRGEKYDGNIYRN